MARGGRRESERRASFESQASRGPVPGLRGADVLAPRFRVFHDPLPEHLDAFRQGEVDDFHAVSSQPVQSPRKVKRLSDDHSSDPELPHEPAAVPAGRERRHHDLVAVVTLAPRLPKRVRFAVCGRITLLNASVVAAPEKRSALVEESGADRDSAFGETEPGLGEGNLDKGQIVQRGYSSEPGRLLACRYQACSGSLDRVRTASRHSLRARRRYARCTRRLLLALVKRDDDRSRPRSCHSRFFS